MMYYDQNNNPIKCGICHSINVQFEDGMLYDALFCEDCKADLPLGLDEDGVWTP
jgi:hypothetical protein